MNMLTPDSLSPKMTRDMLGDTQNAASERSAAPSNGKKSLPESDIVKKQINAGILPGLMWRHEVLEEKGMGRLHENDASLEWARMQKDILLEGFRHTKLLDPQSDQHRQILQEVRLAEERDSDAAGIRKFIVANFQNEEERAEILKEFELNLNMQIAKVAFVLMPPELKGQFTNDPFIVADEEYRNIFLDPKTENWNIPPAARKAYFLFRKAYLHYGDSNGSDLFSSSWKELQKYLSHFPILARLNIWGMVFEKRFRVLGKMENETVK